MYIFFNDMAISYITFSLINQIFIKFDFPDPVRTRKGSGSGSGSVRIFLKGAPNKISYFIFKTYAFSDTY